MRNKTFVASEATYQADKTNRLTLEFQPYDTINDKHKPSGKVKFDVEAFHQINYNTIFFVIEQKDFKMLSKIESQAIAEHTFFVEFCQVNKETGRHNLTKTVFLFERVKSVKKDFFTNSERIYVTMQMR